MKPFWLVAKYVEDLRRREPKNVGVILFADGNVYPRFLGMRDGGRLDRRVLRWMGSAANYAAWVQYWTDAVACTPVEQWRDLLKRSSDDNYFLEVGGERLFGGFTDRQTADDFADMLFATLVGTPAPGALNVAQLTEALLARLDISERVERDFSLQIPSSPDNIRFDYRFDNGATHLMKRVSLSVPGDRAWEQLHAAAWTFEKAKSAPADKEMSLIALVRTRPEDDDLHRQMAVLGERSTIIDVGEPEKAASVMKAVLHLSA